MANVITGTRIVLALILIFCPTFSGLFYIVYILGGISDVLDGIVARRLGQTTKFGAQFDTVSDFIFVAVVIIKVVQPLQISSWLLVWIISIAVIKCINLITALKAYKSIVPEHTIMNKICGILLFAIPICIGLFSCQLCGKLIIATCIAASFAAIQEGYYIHIGKVIS